MAGRFLFQKKSLPIHTPWKRQSWCWLLEELFLMWSDFVMKGQQSKG
jgi:hypothetical protein